MAKELIMNNTEIFNILQNAVADAGNDKISISNISSYTSINNTCGIKFSATKTGVTVPFFFGFSNDKKYLDYVVLGILNSDRNENIDLISVDEDNSKNLIQDKFKFNKKFLSKEESSQIKKLSKWLNDEINGFFMLFKMFNKKLFETEVETNSKEKTSVKENKKEYIKSTKAAPKEESYDNITTGTWFKIVELPWLITLTGFGVYSLGDFITNPTETQKNVILYISAVIMLLGFVGILATNGKKKKIRKAKGLVVSKNPYSWFISKLGKVFGGTYCFFIGFGLIYLLFLLKDFILSSTLDSTNSSSASYYSSSSSRSYSDSSRSSNSRSYSDSLSRTRSTSSSSNSSYSKPRSISYYCQYCGAKFSSISSLTGNRCQKHPDGSFKGYHSPYQGNEKKNYYCEYCGSKFSSISNLTSNRCSKHPNGSFKGYHSPYQGNEKSQYFCKYCGAKFSSISSLTSNRCQKHPDGSFKGYHSPSI